MTKRIEGHDVIAPGFTNQAIQDALKLEVELNKLVGHFKQLFTLSSQMANAANTNSSAGISNLTTAYTQATTASKGYMSTLAELSDVQIRINNNIIKSTEEVKRTKASYTDWWKMALKDLDQYEREQAENFKRREKEKADAVRETTRAEREAYNERKRALEDAFKNSPYKLAVKQMHELKATIKDLIVAGKGESVVVKELISEYEKLNAVIRQAETTVGEYQRNVGNYATAQKKYNYEMFQMTQILRELPNFAISSRIGIMSLSNNLPQLGDAFRRVREDGNSFIKTLGIFARSIVSWQTLILVAITVAIAFADEIGKLFSGEKALTEAQKERIEATKQLNKEVEDLNKSYIKEKLTVEQLVRIASDENETKVNRKRAIEELNKISPEYLGNLTLENVATEQGIALVNTYIALMEKRARAAGLMKRLESIEMEKYDLEQGKIYVDAFQRDKVRELIGDESADAIESIASFDGTLSASSKNYQKVYKELATKKIGQRYAQLDAESQAILGNIEGLGSNAFLSTPKGSGKAAKDSKEKAAKSAVADNLNLIKTQYQIEANEQARLHELRIQQAGQDNFKLQMEERDHQQAMIDLKMKSLATQIAIMETAKAKLTDAELQQLAILRSEYELLAAQMVKNGFVVFDSGLTDKSKSDSDSFIVGKRGPTSKDSDKPKDMVKDIMDLAKAISDIMTRMEKAQQTQLDRQIDATKRKQETLRLLAAQGVKDAKDNLAFEEKKQAELEQKQRQIERAAIRRQTALAAMNAYASKSQRGEANAVGSTIGDLTALLGFASSIPGFNKGIENVSDVDAIAKRNTAVDPFLAWLHPNERVLTAQQNAMIGSMSNEQLANLAYNFKNGLYITNSSDATLSELREIKSAIKNSQPPSWSWNDIEKAIEYKYSKGDKIHREIHKVGGIWGG